MATSHPSNLSSLIAVN
uniref:Uncharacterized protein n=1 Tax=Arundo donax TaxID=35708 RepID=A0A0A9FPM1_ARUDO